jgi:hypothetical protein
MNHEPLRNKDIVKKKKKALIARTDDDEGYRADAANDWEHAISRARLFQEQDF